MADEYIPEVDTSYGLIYRLNYLWAKADGEALAGKLNEWELVLDRIFSNLLYREVAVLQTTGKKTTVTFTDENIKAQEQLKKDITSSKSKRFQAIREGNRTNFLKAQVNHYQAVMNYDIWLRKFMHNELKLYMKEVESTPGRSLFGKAAFGKKRR